MNLSWKLTMERGYKHFLSSVLWASSWWLVGPGLLGSILTWPRTLYITPDYSYTVLDVSVIFLALTLQYLIPFHLFLFVFLRSPPPPMVPSGGSLLLYPLALPVALSSTHPHWAVTSLLSPHRLLLSLAQIWLLLAWVRWCSNHSSARGPIKIGTVWPSEKSQNRDSVRAKEPKPPMEAGPRDLLKVNESNPKGAEEDPCRRR